MDVLSDVLRIVRLTGSIFFTADLSAPWSIDSPESDRFIRQLPGNAECMTLFHFITRGRCWFRTANGSPFSAERGDVVIFPHGSSHIMCSDQALQPVPLEKLISFEKLRKRSLVEYGGVGDLTRFICCYLLCDQRFNPMLGAIPEVIVLQPADRLHREEDQSYPHIIPIGNNDWLDHTLMQLAAEVSGGNVGHATIVTRLAELMYIEVLRRYMKSLPNNAGGWLAALRDPQVGRALKAMHARPESKWNVQALAAEVGASRSAFARRFTTLLGDSPIRYLTTWRMQLAKSFLIRPEMTLQAIAEKSGYESEIAFNRAFKRNVGVPPGQWRVKMLTLKASG